MPASALKQQLAMMQQLNKTSLFATTQMVSVFLRDSLERLRWQEKE